MEAAGNDNGNQTDRRQLDPDCRDQRRDSGASARPGTHN
jgi:hypothetical protein